MSPQPLDDYEAGLGFVPVWVDIDQAIENNRALFSSGKNTDAGYCVRCACLKLYVMN
jgi:hypothetical protein